MILDHTTRKIKCDYCNIISYKPAREWTKSKHCQTHYCNKTCHTKAQTISPTVDCCECGKQFSKRPYQISKTKNNFCSKSCAATYNNQHKTTGTRISKLEVWLQQQLTSLYPNLEIHYNRKDAIRSELDIYIPSLKLAFEMNGVFHYEPIYGEDKLKQTINNDTRKFAACQEADISLCIIDTSTQKYFKSKTAQPFLDIIVDIITNKSSQGEH